MALEDYISGVIGKVKEMIKAQRQLSEEITEVVEERERRTQKRE